MNTHKWTARVVGMLFLVATGTYIYGSGLVESILNTPDYLLHVYPNRNQVVTGVFIQFVTAAANVAIGVLLFPILKKHSETVALGYVVTRVFDGAGIVIGGIGILSLIALSQETIQAGTANASYALTVGNLTVGNLIVAGSQTIFLVTMAALGLGAIPFCYVLYRARLIPRAFSVLGIIGYVALLGGSLLEIYGFNLNMIHFLPGGIFELVVPLWLIVKGFNTSAIAPDSAQTDAIASEQMRLSRA